MSNPTARAGSRSVVRQFPGPGASGPWFQGRPRVTAAVAAVLFAAVSALRLALSTEDPVTVFYCLPVALLAVAFGRWAGTLAGLAALGLTAVHVAVAGLHPSALAWTTWAVPVLLLGALLGDATDHLRAAQRDRRRLEAARLRHRDAVEIQDGVVQGLAAAKWALEAGRTGRALEIVTRTLTGAEALVSALLRDADRAIGSRARPAGRG
jgi:signal transduction histidine kinase